MSALELEVSAAARGDRAAYARLVDGHKGLVASIALAIVGDVATSEDVAQDVFLHAWRSLPSLRSAHSFLPWLRQLTRNRAHKQLQARVRRPWTLASEEALLASAADAREGPDATLATAQEQGALADALEELPDEQREVLILYYREGQSARQVADLLGLREAAVKKRLSRARARLRQDVLARLGEAAERTRPGESFSAMVLAALPSAGAAGIPLAGGAGKAASGAGKLALGKLGLLAGGALVGALSALTGVLAGSALAFRSARTAGERRGTIVGGLLQVALVVGFVPLYAWLSDSARSPWLAFASFVCFALALNAIIFAYVRRSFAARHAEESARDPALAAHHRRRRLTAIGGALIGTACGLAGAITNLMNHLP